MKKNENSMYDLRLVQKSDIPALKMILKSIELFPPEMLDDMIADFFNNPDSLDIWFTAEQNNTPLAIGYCAPESLTDGTYNLYAIGVRSDLQGNGIGGQMMAYLEKRLTEQGSRLLIVETSSLSEFKLTRKFYENLGYNKEATLRDFWKEGDDKIIYCKKLKGATRLS